LAGDAAAAASNSGDANPASAAASSNSSGPSPKQQAELAAIEAQPRASLASLFPADLCGAPKTAIEWPAPSQSAPLRADALQSQSQSQLQRADADARLRAVAAAPQPSFRDFCALISNAAVLPKSERASYETLRRKYNALFAARADAAAFTHLCSAYRSNAFGIFTSTDGQVALAVYPTASYFNHSCAPNLIRRMDGKAAAFYAARDIGQGEPLTICYAAGFKSTAARREYLLENYRFWCRCALCEPSDASSAATAVSSTASECATCGVKGRQRPLRDAVSGRVVARECCACLTVVSNSA
jgi:hypothetical protein